MTAVVAAGTTSHQQHKMPQVDARSTFWWKKHKHHQILNYIYILIYIWSYQYHQHRLASAPIAWHVNSKIRCHRHWVWHQCLAPEVAPATKLHQLAWQHRRRERENLASQTFGPSQSLTIFVAMQASCKHHHRHPMARCKANFSKELRSLNDMPSMMQLPRALFFAKEWRGSPRVFQPQWLRGSGRHNPAHCKYNIIQWDGMM